MVVNDDSKLARLLRWRAGETPGPWTVSLFPTNRCNLRCPICWQRNPAGEVHLKDEVRDERLLRFVDEGAQEDVREWLIIGGGEPMVRGDLVIELCARIRGHGMNGALQTNGTLFKPAHLERLVDMGWGRIKVSLDGPTVEINDAVRSAGSFERATANLRLLAKLREEAGVAAPVVDVYAVLTALNCDKLDRMVDLTHALGRPGGCLDLTTMLLHSEEGAPFQLTPQQKAELPGHIRRALDRALELGVSTNLANYLNEDLVTNPNAVRPLRQRPVHCVLESMCFEPWLTMVVLPRGNVGPCCVYDETGIYTSIKTLTFREAWLGPYLQDVRRRILEGQPPQYCSTCPAPLFAQSELLRPGALYWLNELRRRELPWPQRVAWYMRKASGSVRKHGVRGALRRGTQWMHVTRQREEHQASSRPDPGSTD